MSPTRDKYIGQVRLLLTVLPFVAAREDFALKGGTAINFFFRDGPRLSVDIDLHYLPNTERNAALAGIQHNMQEIREAVTTTLPGSRFTINPKTANGLIEYQGATIKLEPNNVIRGTLLPPVTRPLCQSLADQFKTAPQVRCVDHAELYAGKLCAALQRQHPRDLFDVHLLLGEEGLSRELIEVFIVYLIRQGKPIAELLDPRVHPIDDLYRNQFQGMTDSTVNLDQLKDVQSRLPSLIRMALSETDKAFLLGFKRGEPDWSLVRHSHAQDLPAVRWKQLNLDRMEIGKRATATDQLQQVLDKDPEQRETDAMAEKKPTSQIELADSIAKELVEIGLISAEHQADLASRIATGTLKPDDWGLMIEMAKETEQNDD